MNIENDKIYGEKEAAEILDRAPSTLQKARHYGFGGPAFIKQGRSVKYLGADLIAYIDSCRRTSTAQKQAA